MAMLLLIKIFLNSVIFIPVACFMNIDLANFYLMTPLKKPEFAKIQLSNILEEIIQEYILHNKATPNGWIYIRCSYGKYGLPKAGSLRQDLLEQCLNEA